MTTERQDQPNMDRLGASGQPAECLSASGASTDCPSQDNAPSTTRSPGLAQLFEAQAGSTPEAIALVEGSRMLTYAELDRHAGRFAEILLNTGAGPEQVFAILSPATIESIVAILGILKAGAAFCRSTRVSPISASRRSLVTRDRPVSSPTREWRCICLCRCARSVWRCHP